MRWMTFTLVSAEECVIDAKQVIAILQLTDSACSELLLSGGHRLAVRGKAQQIATDIANATRHLN